MINSCSNIKDRLRKNEKEEKKQVNLVAKARDNEKVTRNGKDTDILRKSLMTNQMTREGGVGIQKKRMKVGK